MRICPQITTVAIAAFIFGSLAANNPAAAIDFKAPVPDLGGSSPAAKLVCKPRVVAQGSGRSQASLANGTYMARTRERWKQRVVSRYGAAFSQWSLALNRRGACTTVRTVPAGQRFVCSVAATPCSVAR